MRLAALLLLVPTSVLADGWTDVPALLAEATAPVAAEVAGCTKLPKRIGIDVGRAKDGSTTVGMPMTNVGHRGLTKEERCLMAAIAKVKLPALPAELERVGLAHTFGGTAVDFGEWRDPAAVLARTLDADRRAALAACGKGRSVRLVLDLSHGKTRIWLPAWQFHTPGGDGSTPAPERRVKACLTKAIRTWSAPVLPADMGELQVALRP
jgi:hypothetical protein